MRNAHGTQGVVACADIFCTINFLEKYVILEKMQLTLIAGATRFRAVHRALVF